MKKQNGFTLVELLVVIAVVGVLAAVSLTLLNPVEYFNRAKDSKLQQGTSQIVKALVAYKAANGTYPAQTNNAACGNGNWFACLTVDKAIFTTVPDPVGISTPPGCTTGTVVSASNTDYCYKVNSTSGNIVVYTLLQSKLTKNNCASGTLPYYTWHSNTERVGVECITSGSEPTAP